MGVLWQDVDEVGDLHLALCLVLLAALRLSCVRVIFLTHDRVLNSVLEGVRVQTTVAAPGSMVAVEDLLNGQADHSACLEEGVTLHRING